jgi:hypothetical protein
MVQTTGDNSGGKGSGSAPSSILEFIDCTFTGYLGKAVHIDKGRATFANCEFKSTINKGAIIDPNLTAVGIFCSPDTRLDIRGGNFLGNDIAIDALQASLYIGHAAKEYKQRPLQELVFQNNTIAIHSTEGYSKIQYSNFKENEVALLDLNGEIDIEKNSNNKFENNRIAIGFSNELKAWKGKNLFINNNNDITYILPSNVPTEKAFDLTCNYWYHDGNAYDPLISITDNEDGAYQTDSISFITIPYLINKKNGNYVCKEGKGIGLRTSGTDTTTIFQSGENQVDTYNLKIKEIVNLLKNKELTKANNKLNNLKNEIKLVQKDFGHYQLNQPLYQAYQAAIFKNTLLSFVQENKESPNKDDFFFNETANNLFDKDLIEAFPEIDNQTFITQDRLSFIDLLLTTQNKKISGINMPISESKPAVIKVFPNPFITELKISLSVKEEGLIQATIYNINGTPISEFINEPLNPGNYTFSMQVENYNKGLYVLVLKHKNKVIESYKLLKQ